MPVQFFQDYRLLELFLERAGYQRVGAFMDYFNILIACKLQHISTRVSTTAREIIIGVNLYPGPGSAGANRAMLIGIVQDFTSKALLPQRAMRLQELEDGVGYKIGAENVDGVVFVGDEQQRDGEEMIH